MDLNQYEIDRYYIGLKQRRTAINNHSIRKYDIHNFGGLMIDRTNDIEGKPFEAYAILLSLYIVPCEKLEIPELKQDNLTWNQALKIIGNFIESTGFLCVGISFE